MTGVNLKSGTDRCEEAYRKLGAKADVVVNIQGDEPFVHPTQLEAIKSCFEKEATQIATLVKPFRVADGLDALLNPNSPKIVVDADMKALYFSRSVIPYLRGVNQEDWLATHQYYKHIGLYAYRSNVLKEISSLPQGQLEKAESLEQLRWLENGYVIRVGLTDIETTGIDEPKDLQRAETYLKTLKV